MRSTNAIRSLMSRASLSTLSTLSTRSTRSTRPRLSVVSLATTIAVLSACSTTEVEPPWREAVVFDAGEKLGGCALGDLDPNRAGDELAVVAGSGAVWMIAYEEGAWISEKVGDLPGEMIQCAIGDVMPEHPGDELVMVGIKEGGEDDGGPGVAWVAWRDANGWNKELIVEDHALLHAVCIGDFVDGSAAQALLVAGYSGNALVFVRDAGAWRQDAVIGLTGPAKGASAGLGGAVIVDAEGALLKLSRDDGLWQRTELAKFEDSLARVTATSDEVLFCANDGKLRLWSAEGVETVYSTTDRLRGAIFIDMDPGSYGVELATAGYDGNITLIRAGAATFTPQHIAHDDGRFHHLARGSISGLGDVLAGCGYSGRVTVAWRVAK
jgi:hypothetical protein